MNDGMGRDNIAFARKAIECMAESGAMFYGEPMAGPLKEFLSAFDHLAALRTGVPWEAINELVACASDDPDYREDASKVSHWWIAYAPKEEALA